MTDGCALKEFRIIKQLKEDFMSDKEPSAAARPD